MLHEWFNLIRSNRDYADFLSLMGGLSGLFSESDIPFIHYRIVENLFCKCFQADNLARTDTSFDAKLNGAGIGIKTFLLDDGKPTLQKIAEFDRLSDQLNGLRPEEIAQTVSLWRNERIQIANRIHGISEPSIYHVVGRSKGALNLFCTSYDAIHVDEIKLQKSSPKSIAFTDGENAYAFNIAKSVLMERFSPSDDCLTIPVSILSDPYEILRRLLQRRQEGRAGPPADYVVLPLYSSRNKTKVPEKSGLNQWNAAGRPRDPDEIYVPIPAAIHQNRPEFFPGRETPFTLKLPDGRALSAKICQDGGKGLMSNPNKALGGWLLRDVFKLKKREVLTMDHLNRFGIDSLIIIKEKELVYRAEISRQAHFESFLTMTDGD